MHLDSEAGHCLQWTAPPQDPVLDVTAWLCLLCSQMLYSAVPLSSVPQAHPSLPFQGLWGCQRHLDGFHVPSPTACTCEPEARGGLRRVSCGSGSLTPVVL